MKISSVKNPDFFSNLKEGEILNFNSKKFSLKALFTKDINILLLFILVF